MLKDFISLCQLTQEDLLKVIPGIISQVYSSGKIESTKDYIYVTGNIPVLLVAHLDTVHDKPPLNIWFSANKNKIKADEGIGGDDRCGIYAICEIIKSGVKPHLLFTTDEEIGAIGAEIFCNNHEDIPVNLMIELDRKGSNDAVRYEDDNDELLNVVAKYGFKEAMGSFTDICVLSEKYGISGINLSVGYYKQHTNEEYVVFSELNNTINRVIELLRDSRNYCKKLEYKQKEYSNLHNFYRYDLYGNYRDFICNCDICNKKVNVFETQETPDGVICDECFNQYASNYRKCSICEGITYADEKKCEWCGLEDGDYDV